MIESEMEYRGSKSVQLVHRPRRIASGTIDLDPVPDALRRGRGLSVKEQRVDGS